MQKVQCFKLLLKYILKKLTYSPRFLQTGLFKLSDEEFFIQPLEKSRDETSAPQAHAIYKRHASPPSWSPVVQPISRKQALNGTCGIKSKSQCTQTDLLHYLPLVFCSMKLNYIIKPDSTWGSVSISNLHYAESYLLIRHLTLNDENEDDDLALSEPVRKLCIIKGSGRWVFSFWIHDEVFAQLLPCD